MYRFIHPSKFRRNVSNGLSPRSYLIPAPAHKATKIIENNDPPGTPICVAATHVQRLVLAVTPFNHNNNYRSAIIHGWANMVTDQAEKLYASEQITNHVIANRWQNLIPPTDADLKSTGVLRVDTASAGCWTRRFAGQG